MKRLVLAVLVLGLAATWSAAAEVVFSIAPKWERDPAAAPAAYTLAAAVTVDEGWHVNSHTPLSEDLIPTTLRLELPSGWTAGEPVFPKHRKARFEFSEEPVAVHEGTFVIRVPVTIPAGTDTAMVVKAVVNAQACNDRECLPPADAAVTIAHPAVAGVTTVAAPPAKAAAQPSHEGLGGRFAGAGLWLQLLLTFVAGLSYHRFLRTE